MTTFLKTIDALVFKVFSIFVESTLWVFSRVDFTKKINLFYWSAKGSDFGKLYDTYSILIFYHNPPLSQFFSFSQNYFGGWRDIIAYVQSTTPFDYTLAFNVATPYELTHFRYYCCSCFTHCQMQIFYFYQQGHRTAISAARKNLGSLFKISFSLHKTKLMWTYIDRQYIQAIYFLIFPIISISRNVSSVFTPKGTIFYPPSHTHRALT